VRSWVDRGADAVVIEVSSHGLEQGRVRGLEFDVGIFTNLSQDHLDYHGSMENYFQAKRILLTQSRIPVVYAGDSYGQRLIEEFDAVSVGEDADYEIRQPRVGLEGIECVVRTPGGEDVELKSSLTGLFNYKNISLSATAALELDCGVDVVRRGIQNCEYIPGRCERLEGPPPVIVDYAHTPDALENVISSLQPLVDKRLICVFGAGGDRDRGKRPKMGRIAEEEADYSIVTSDNPRSEPPMEIIEDILEGMNGRTNYQVEVDRGQAIRKAIQEATREDLVLIVGRGHETEQSVGDRKIPFEDSTVAREVLESVG